MEPIVMARIFRRLSSLALGGAAVLLAMAAARPVFDFADLSGTAPPSTRARLDAAVAGIRGGAAVVWTDEISEPSSFIRHAIRGRFLDNTRATGAIWEVADAGLDPDFEVDCPAVAALSPGRIVVAWSGTRFGGRDVAYRRFQKTGLDGAPLGLADAAEAQDDNVDDCPAIASVATANASAFALAWRETALAGGAERIEARLFDGEGSPSSAPIVVAAPAAGQRLGSRVAAGLDRNRRLAVAYLVRPDEAAQTGDLLVRRFDRSGRPAGAAVRAGRRATGEHALATLPGGGFALAWATPTPAGVSLAIRRFGADGRPSGPQHSLTDAPGFAAPRLAADSFGALLVWRAADRLWGLALDGDLRPSGGRFEIAPLPAAAHGSGTAGTAGTAYLGPNTALVAWPATSAVPPNSIRGRIYSLGP